VNIEMPDGDWESILGSGDAIDMIDGLSGRAWRRRT